MRTELRAAVNPPPPYRRPAEDVVHSLATDASRGLSSTEASRRLERDGSNRLPSIPPVPAWRRFLGQFKDVLTALLLAATAVSSVTWWIERDLPVPYEALAILAIVILNGVLGFVQESRAERAVAALRAMTAPTARVLRDAERQLIAATALVPGDLIVLEEGDTIPADARVIQSIGLRVAEAPLTGESTPVSKDADPLSGESGIGDQSNMVFSGTAIAAGRGRAIVVATGPATEIGKIAGAMQATESVKTPLQRELDWLGRLLGVVVLAISLAVGTTILLGQQVRALSDLVEVLLFTVSLAVAAVPEGLAAITTVVLSVGTRRMAERNVIVRKLAAVETLGSTTVICSDKTGTLTRNEMTVRTVVTASGSVELTGTGYDPSGAVRQGGVPVSDPSLREEVERTLAAGALASNAVLVRRDGRWGVHGDPTEGALVVAAHKARVAPAEAAGRFRRVGEVPFSSGRKLMSTAHADSEDDGHLMVFVKGAPDVLLARCDAEQVGDKIRPLIPARVEEIGHSVEQLGTAALRTLGVAYRTLDRGAVAGELSDDVEQSLVWLGVVGMMDRPRPEARAAVDGARRAGVRPILITGDHPVTAAAIAADLAISPREGRAVSGPELDRMDDVALREAVRETSVYARVAPEHKLRIVRALQANGEVAAMTGDGVNDAPALKAADIGVAMGLSGTDVAKGAADMILADDNFASIVAAVEEGRSIYSNIQRFLRYLLSSNAGEVLAMFFGVVLAAPLGLTPVEGSVVVVPLLATQILWINLLTDSGPALALGMEPSDPGVMRRPPRDPRRHVITRRMWWDTALVGVVMAVGTLGLMDWALPGGLFTSGETRGLRHAQTLAFTTLVFYSLFHALNARFEDRSAFHRLFANRWLWFAIVLSIALQVAVVYVPFLQTAFRTAPLRLIDWLVCTAVASSVLWAMELNKFASRQRGARN